MEILNAVRLICASSFPAFSALPEAASHIDSYLFENGRYWTLETAAATGSVRLMNLVAQLEWSGFDYSARKRRFDCGIEQAIRHGQPVDILEWWLTVYIPERVDTAVIAQILKLACMKSRLDVLQWTHKRGIPRAFGPVGVDCEKPEIANWVYQHLRGYAYATYCLDFETEDGFKMLKLGYSRGSRIFVYGLYDSLLDQIAADGPLEAVEWVSKQENVKWPTTALDWAVYRGRLDVAQWLYAHHPRGYFKELKRGCDDLETVQWVLSNHDWSSPLTRQTWISSSLACCAQCLVPQKDVNVVECLFLACPDADRGQAMSVAARRGDLALVQRLHANGATFSSMAMFLAITEGHLPVVKWLHRFEYTGCMMSTTSRAAIQGHFEVIQWLHSHMSEGFSNCTLESAVSSGHLEMVKWLLANRTEGCTTQAMECAASRGHLHIVRWLDENLPLTNCIKHAMERAARNGHLDIIKYLFDKYPSEEFAQPALSTAAWNGHMSIMQYLVLQCKITLVPSEDFSLLCRKRFGEIDWLLRNCANLEAKCRQTPL